MTAKYGCWRTHRAYVGSVALLCAVAASFMVLQRVCLNNSTNAFVDHYCLSDSNMRTVIASYLTVFTALLQSMVSDAADAFRVSQLEHGISEGVYIALATSSPFKYKARTFALGGRWGAFICVVAILFVAPNALQTATNPFIYTNSIYVRNKSTASIVPNIGNYSSPALTSIIQQSLQAGASAYHLEQQEHFLGFSSAFSILLQVRAFSAGEASSRSQDGTVTTTVVRFSYLDSTVTVDGDLSNALRQRDTLATVSTWCNITTDVTTRLVDLQTDSSQGFNFTATNAAITSDGQSLNATTLFITDFSFAVNSSDSVTMQSSSFVGVCFECQPLLASQFVSGNLTSCTSTITFSDQEFVYTVSTGSVTPLQTISTSTTVDPYTAGLLIAGNAASADNSVNLLPPNSDFALALAEQYVAYPQGLFDNNSPNIVHNKLCSAASQTLEYLWIGAVNASTAEGIDALLSDVPLYNIVLLTHVSTPTAAITVGVLIVFAVTICAVGMVFSHRSPINIKAATENALVDSLDDDYIAHKRAGAASNDPDLQVANAFDRVTQLYRQHIYCRALPSNPHHTPNARPSPVTKVRGRLILTRWASSGVVPHKQVDYS